MTDLPKRIALTFAAMLAAGAAAAQPAPQAIPLPAPSKEALAALPDTRLFYWDTGGDGTPVVLVHPATGSALIWGYQQPVLAKA
ncbi:MAG TPA: alpha/beta hydrolase, partial [Steroidobacteraceae bacterium]|nr:alpha/beta hydrolase [Steroidobacteraceae bacterium]